MNLYAYVGNDPLNATDPTGMDTRVRVRAYRLRGVSGALGYGHAYVQYDDTDSDQSRITRGGLSSLEGNDGVFPIDAPTEMNIDFR